MSESKLIEAVRTENRAAIQQLPESDAEIHEQDKERWTPLNWASGKGNLEIVKLLVENGADVFMSARDNHTPYMIAIAASRVEAIKYLRDVEDKTDLQKAKSSSSQERPYCKACRLEELRKFSDWQEVRVNWKENKDADESADGELEDDDIIYIL